MPAIGRPRELDFGATGAGSDLTTEQGEPWLFSMNRRFVYRTIVGSNSIARARFEVPRCWSAEQVADNSSVAPVSADDLPQVLRRAQPEAVPLFLEELSPQFRRVVVCPLGLAGRWGLAVLDLSASTSSFPIGEDRWTGSDPNESSVEYPTSWELHLADLRPGSNETVSNSIYTTLAASQNFVFMSQRGDGVAVFRRRSSMSDRYAYLGSFQLPGWGLSDTGVQRHPACQTVSVFQQGGREILAAAAEPHSFAPFGGDPGDALYPRAFLFDVTDASAVVAALPPAGPGQPPPLDSALVPTCAVLSSLQSTSGDTPEVTAVQRRTWGVGVGALPGTDAQVLTTASTQAVDLWDVTDLGFGFSGAPLLSDPELDPALLAFDGASSFGSYGRAIGPAWHRDSFAISTGSIDCDGVECGPPSASAATADYPQVAGLGLRPRPLVAGRFVVVGSFTYITWTGEEQGNAGSLLFLDYADVSRPSEIRLRRAGVMQPMLNITAAQYEAVSAFHYEPATGSVYGSVKAHLGLVRYQLPPQDRAQADSLACAIAPDATTSVACPAPAPTPQLEPAGPACPPPCDSLVQTASYTDVRVGASFDGQSDPFAPGLPLSPSAPGANQLPANLCSDLFDESFPDLVGWGYGGEWMHGTSISRTTTGGSTQTVLLLSDRASRCVIAHQADGLDGLGIAAWPGETRPPAELQRDRIQGCRACAALPWPVGGDDFLLAAVGGITDRLHLVRWAWGSGDDPGSFDTASTGMSLVASGQEAANRPRTVVALSPIASQPASSPGSFALPTIEAAISHYAEAWDLLVVEGRRLVAGASIVPGIATISRWRFPRQIGPDGQPQDQLHEDLEAQGFLTGARPKIFDLVDSGEHVYCLVIDQNQYGESGVAPEHTYFLVTLRKRAYGPVLDTGQTLGVLGSQWPREELASVDGIDWHAEGALSFDLVHVLRLPTPVQVATEIPRLFISPNGRWLMAMSSSLNAGCWFIDVGDPEAPGWEPSPSVQAGWRWDAAAEPQALVGWDVVLQDLEQVMDDLHFPVGGRGGGGRGRAPAWPLSSATAGSPQGLNPTLVPALEAHSSGFFEDAGGGQYLALNTDPVTLWKIEPTYVVSDPFGGPLLYIGAICSEASGRLRVCVSGQECLWMIGDRGCFAIPLTEAESGTDCCSLAGPGGLLEPPEEPDYEIVPGGSGGMTIEPSWAEWLPPFGPE